MGSKGTEKRALNDRPALLAIIVVFVVTGLLFVWSKANYRSDGSGRDTWIDEAGRVHVLGIVLGQTTLRDAEKALKSRSDIALYIYPDTHKEAGIRLEAYFPSIMDHSKVILLLDADRQMLEQIQQRSTIPHLYPNKVARMNLHPTDQMAVQSLPVHRLTLIPSVAISLEMLEARFGTAVSVSHDEEGVRRYHFPEVGMEAKLSEKDVATLRFTNPAGEQPVRD